MSENERLNALAVHYYAVAQHMEACARDQLRVAIDLAHRADRISELAIHDFRAFMREQGVSDE